jgi:hypothetical protein
MRARAAELGIAPSCCICTGDVVAYCGEPEETIAAIRDWACHVIAGNCEEQLAVGAGDCGCGFEKGTECDQLAKDWYEFANERISCSDRAWMASLPKALSFTAGRGVAFLVVHGGLDVIKSCSPPSDLQLARNLSAPAPTPSSPGIAGSPSLQRSSSAYGSIRVSLGCRQMMAPRTLGTV